MIIFKAFELGYIVYYSELPHIQGIGFSQEEALESLIWKLQARLVVIDGVITRKVGRVR